MRETLDQLSGPRMAVMPGCYSVVDRGLNAPDMLEDSLTNSAEKLWERNPVAFGNLNDQANQIFRPRLKEIHTQKDAEVLMKALYKGAFLAHLCLSLSFGRMPQIHETHLNIIVGDVEHPAGEEWHDSLAADETLDSIIMRYAQSFEYIVPTSGEVEIDCLPLIESGAGYISHVFNGYLPFLN